MLAKIDALRQEIAEAKLTSQEELEKFRLKFITKKGNINALFDEFKSVANDLKKEVGQKLNELKNAAQDKFKHSSELLDEQGEELPLHIDLTLPYLPNSLGTIHPITIVRDTITRIFERIGFNLSDGPEIEDDWHNFEALNFPHNHPARDMQDTFFISKQPDLLLRTHTSSVQVRVMENQKPPFRTLSIGRVYRNEAISARAHCIFHQVEGFYVDKNVSFTDMKQTLFYFAKELFGPDTQIRLRPSYFPFTEPSAEMDVSCNICQGDGCNVCKHTGWLEILGCGMIDPNVLKNCGIDPDEYSGFAFGMGIERITMLKYKINDLRLFTENDIRFLRQFSGVS